MIETLTVITLSILFLIFFRPGKTPPLENRLTIERPGRYHALLAPKLNLAQPFIELIVERFESAGVPASQSSAACLFSIQDKNINTPNHNNYLLVVVYKDAMLHFQAEWPLSANPTHHLETLKTLAVDILKEIPASGVGNEALGAQINSSVLEAAAERGTAVTLLTE